MPTKKYKTPSAALAARREKMSGYRRESYARAAKVTPPVRLDPVQAEALQKIMEAMEVGPGNAVRWAIVSAAKRLRGNSAKK